MDEDHVNSPLPGYAYWDDYPDYPHSDWAQEAANDNTRQGYWTWVRGILEADDELDQVLKGDTDGLQSR